MEFTISFDWVLVIHLVFDYLNEKGFFKIAFFRNEMELDLLASDNRLFVFLLCERKIVSDCLHLIFEFI